MCGANGASISNGTVTNLATGEIDLTGSGVLKSGSLGNAGTIKVSGTETYGADKTYSDDIQLSGSVAVHLKRTFLGFSKFTASRSGT